MGIFTGAHSSCHEGDVQDCHSLGKGTDPCLGNMLEDTEEADGIFQGPDLPWRGIQGLIHVLLCHSWCWEASDLCIGVAGTITRSPYAPS